MSAIEPNWPALVWVAVLGVAGWHGVLTLAGFFPLAARPPQAARPGTDLLIAGAGVLVVLLIAVTGVAGWRELRWTTLVILVGLVILFTPPLHEVLARSAGGPRKGLAVLAGLEAALLAAFLVFGPRLT